MLSYYTSTDIYTYDVECNMDSYFGTKIIAKYENMRHKENFDQYCTKHFTITTLLLNAC